MKRHKKVAGILALMLTASFLPNGVLANYQNPIQEIQKVSVGHNNTVLPSGESSIIPDVQLDWMKPLANEMPEKPGNNDSEQATHYDIAVMNLYNTSNKDKVENILASKLALNGEVYSAKVQDYFKGFLLNGSLYKTQIFAKHKHYVTMAGGNREVLDSPPTGDPIPEAYFITDFNILAEVDNGLTFSWEYIPGISYKLYHAKGQISEISKMSGTGVTISAQDARKHLSKDGTRVEWHVEDAVAGQIYSAYVIPIGIDSKEIKFGQIAYNKETPKIIHATPNIPLHIEKLGEDKLRLSWNINDSAWVTVGNLLYETIIYKINDKGNEEELGRIHNDNNGNLDVGYFECEIPKEATHYRVDFILKNTTTHVVEKGFSAGPKAYIPDELKRVPYQPVIPEPFGYQEGNTISSEDIRNQSKYKVKFNNSYDDLILTNNNITQFKAHTFHYEIEGDTASIQLVWDAPELDRTGKVDDSLYYDVWVSESSDYFKPENKMVSDLKIDQNDPEQVIYKMDGVTVVGMKTTLEGLLPNKTYYIKMTAKRKYGDGSESVSNPVIKQISIPKIGDAYAPPVVGKPPLQIHSVSEHALQVKWAREWYEIMAKPSMLPLYEEDPVEKLLASWGHSRVYLTGDQNKPIAFRDEKQQYDKPIDLYGSNIQEKLVPLNGILEQGNYILRSMRIGNDTRYKAKVMKLSEADALRGNKTLEQWVMDTELAEIDNKWLDVTDTLSSIEVEGVPGKLLPITYDHYGEPLEANTPYIVLISAARKVDGKMQYSMVPSYILATTKTDHQSELETPETPRLYNYKDKDVRDTEVTVRWIYNDRFEYELVYSQSEHPETATVWQFTEEDKKTFVDGDEAYVTISDLMPETTYYFWIRAKQKEKLVTTGEVKVSDWSNPVMSTTKTLMAPMPPSGLGLASPESIREAEKDFNPRGADYLTIEWMKDKNDHPATDSHFTYRYIVTFADNPEFLDVTQVTMTDDGAVMAEKQDKTDKVTATFISKNIVRFDGLLANRPYYVKVRTVLHYKNGNKEIIKESKDTQWVRLLTHKSSDEYDGGENGNIVIFDKPIKETYSNGIWTYEMQDTAHITSELLKAGDRYYTITMTNYLGKYDAKTRRIIMPKPVLDTLIEQGMALQVITNLGKYEINGTALRSYAGQYDAKTQCQIDLTRLSSSDVLLYGRQYPEYYHSGEQLAITLGNTKINRLDEMMQVKLKLDLVEAYKYRHYATYQYNESTGSWLNKPHTIETQEKSYLAFNTQLTGLNAIYERKVANETPSASYTMNQISTNYNVAGLGTIFKGSKAVGASQYVQLLLGICLKEQEINLSSPATLSDYQRAKAAGLYISNSRGTLSQEQALAGVVRLYEIRTGYKIKPSTVTFKGTSSTYKEAVSKAYAIGLITELQPQEKVTYGQLCDWLVQVL